MKIQQDLQNVSISAPRSDLPPVRVSYYADEDHWVLLKDYTYEDSPRGVQLTVLQGFTFDLASVPRVLWWGTAAHELGLVGPLFHDALYRYAGVARGHLVIEPHRSYTRKEADELFQAHMKLEGVSWWRRKSAYYAVRGFGSSSWRDDREPFL